MSSPQRMSKQRKAVLDNLESHSTFRSAQEIHGSMENAGETAGLATVYRNLQGFSTQGVVRRTLYADGKARYEMAGHVHHHHLICLDCGGATEVPWCPVGNEVVSFMAESDFSPVSHQFEIYGHCKQCREKK